MNDTQAWKIFKELLFVGKVEFDVMNGSLTVYGKKKTYPYKTHFTDANAILNGFVDTYKEDFKYSYESIPVESFEKGKDYKAVGTTIDGISVNTVLGYKGRLSNTYYIFEDSNGKEFVFENVEGYRRI